MQSYTKLNHSSIHTHSCITPYIPENTALGSAKAPGPQCDWKVFKDLLGSSLELIVMLVHETTYVFTVHVASIAQVAQKLISIHIAKQTNNTAIRESFDISGKK